MRVALPPLPALVLVEISDQNSRAKHQSITIVRPDRVHNARPLESCTFCFCFGWCFMIWKAENFEELASQGTKLRVDLSRSLASLPRSARPIENEGELDIEFE
jgi:hypothetical protein